MTPARIKTLRFLALLVMIAGGLAVPVVFYYGLGNIFHSTSGMRFESHVALQHAMRKGMFALMGGLVGCQVLIGLGGYARYRLKKLLPAT